MDYVWKSLVKHIQPFLDIWGISEDHCCHDNSPWISIGALRYMFCMSKTVFHKYQESFVQVQIYRHHQNIQPKLIVRNKLRMVCIARNTIKWNEMWNQRNLLSAQWFLYLICQWNRHINGVNMKIMASQSTCNSTVHSYIRPRWYRKTGYGESYLVNMSTSEK